MLQVFYTIKLLYKRFSLAGITINFVIPSDEHLKESRVTYIFYFFL